MPLRDHFRPPLDDSRSWDELHGAWPTVIVMSLNRKLPPRYVAAPRVDQEHYEVRVYDTQRHRRLVAAIEIVSPANKDRPEHRRSELRGDLRNSAHPVTHRALRDAPTPEARISGDRLIHVEERTDDEANQDVYVGKSGDGRRWLLR
jgi:hypothetical protein